MNPFSKASFTIACLLCAQTAMAQQFKPQRDYHLIAESSDGEMQQQGSGGQGKSRAGQGGGQGRGGQGGGGLFALLDVDSDGQLSAKEIDGAIAVLTRLDVNKDGILDAQELVVRGPGGKGRQGGKGGGGKGNGGKGPSK